MAMNVFTNVASLNVQRQLGKATQSLDVSFQRLSSGLRINTAKDDAAGLAIAERMDGKIRGLDQARRNAGDGISLVQTVESGLAEMNTILTRLRELAVQSANDSNSATDRAALDNESKQLIKSLDQLASSAEFNGRKILDGSSPSFIFQTGANNSSDERIQVDLTGVRATQLGGLATKSQSAVGATAITAGALSINGIAVSDYSGYADEIGHSTATNLQNSSSFVKAKQINASDTGVKAIAGETKVSFAFASSTVNGDVVINGVTIFSNGAATSADDLVQKINAQSAKTGVTAAVNGANVELTAEDGRNINNGSALNGLSAVTAMTTGELTLMSEKAYLVTGAGHSAILGVAWGAVAVDAENLNTAVDLTNREKSLDSIDRIEAATNKVLDLRAKMGAIQNRLEATSGMLGAMSENLSAARARIRDADFAMETAMLTRNQILQQAASAMLAQANLAPQQALQLLR